MHAVEMVARASAPKSLLSFWYSSVRAAVRFGATADEITRIKDAVEVVMNPDRGDAVTLKVVDHPALELRARSQQLGLGATRMQDHPPHFHSWFQIINVAQKHWVNTIAGKTEPPV